MSDPILLDDSDGFITITFKGKGGEEVSKEIDLYQTHNRIFELGQQFKGKPLYEYHDALVALLVSLGLPPVSHRMAIRFEEQIVEKVAILKNADGGETMHVSPAFTEPAPSPSPALPS